MENGKLEKTKHQNNPYHYFFKTYLRNIDFKTMIFNENIPL